MTPFSDGGGPRLGVVGWGILQILVTGALGFVFHDMQAKDDRIRALEIAAGAKNSWTLTDQRGFEKDVQQKLDTITTQMAELRAEVRSIGRKLQ